MADVLPLPQYQQAPQALPQGLDVAAAVPPNILSQIGPGINAGASLGFQARQVAALEQERQTQMMAAQAAAKVAQQKELTDYMGVAHETYKDIADINPDAAFDFYKKSVAPVHQAFLQSHGIQADFSDVNPQDEHPKNIEMINDAMDMAAKDSSKIPAATLILQKIANDTTSGKLVREKAAQSIKAVGDVSDYNKHQDDLEKDFGDSISATKSRSGGYGQQDQKVDQAIHLRSLANQYYDPKTGNYNVPLAQYKEMVLGLANLVSAGGSADVETRKDLESATSYSQLNKYVQTFTGKPQTGNTQAVIKNLIDSTDRQGAVAQNLRDNYLSQVQPSQSLAPERAQRQIGKGRGADFNEYLPGGKNGPKTAPATPEAYLASIHAKVTPKNIEWAKSQMGNNGQ